MDEDRPRALLIVELNFLLHLGGLDPASADQAGSSGAAPHRGR
jgi:hypothetical protein